MQNEIYALTSLYSYLSDIGLFSKTLSQCGQNCTGISG